MKHLQSRVRRMITRYTERLVQRLAPPPRGTGTVSAVGLEPTTRGLKVRQSAMRPKWRHEPDASRASAKATCTSSEIDDARSGDDVPAAPQSYGIDPDDIAGVSACAHDDRMRTDYSGHVTGEQYGARLPMATARNYSQLVASEYTTSAPQPCGNHVPAYIRAHLALKKNRCPENESRRLAKMAQLLGHLTWEEISTPMVVAAHREIAAGGHETEANRCLSRFSHFWSWALQRGHTISMNPCSGVPRYPERRRDVYLSDEQYTSLYGGIIQAEQRELVSRSSAAAVRVLALTGLRKDEVLSLRRRDVDVDAGVIMLRDSKTGPRRVALSRAAMREIVNAPGDDWVFPSPRKKGERLKDIRRPWKIITRIANIEGVRPHDLRHSFVSKGLRQGVPLDHLAEACGHKSTATTKRYAHLADKELREAVNAIGDSLDELSGEGGDA